MTQASDLETSDAPESGKKKKAKKRPSDFEIFRTILTRTHERKLPYLFKDMGEHSDILFLSSEEEDEFTYGSPDIAIALFEFTDPELKTIITTYLDKIHGLQEGLDHQRIINLRDQISELAKNKGESIDVEVFTNVEGSSWIVKRDIRGVEKTTYYTKVLDSLFQMQLVKTWCDTYRHLLTTDNPDYLYYPYRHPESKTASILTLPAGNGDHRLTQLYPNGYRMMVTKGLDVITDKFLEEFPYPILREEVIVFTNQSSACQIAHRIIADGWRMVLIRPNAVYFPTLKTPLPDTGQYSL